MTRTVYEMLMIFLITIILLAMFNSASLVTWAYDIKTDILSDYIGFLAENWHELMEKLGFAHITQVLREWFVDTTNAI